jgi:hypothetical protein
MGRSTFEGPVLSGDNRFGPLRNVGYQRLSQNCILDFAATGGSGTANYAGGSGQFVSSNNIPNQAAVIYTPSGSVYPPTVVTPTADASTAIYRGAVFYLPINCQIESIVFDYITTIACTKTTISSIALLVSNGFVTSSPTYGTATISSTDSFGTTGRIATTYSATNLNNMLSTPADITTGNNNPPQLSQVVCNLAIVGTGLSALTAGKFNIDINYVQDDNNIGNSTTYPYGNFD